MSYFQKETAASWKTALGSLTKEDFEAQKSKIEVQEAEKAPSSPESQNDIVPAENEPVEVAEEVPHDEIVKEEIPSQNGK